MQHVKITATMFADKPVFLVEVELANGYTAPPQPCDTEEQARVYVRGLEDGFRLAQNALGPLRFNGQITT
jgi:hypothetical protein